MFSFAGGRAAAHRRRACAGSRSEALVVHPGAPVNH